MMQLRFRPVLAAAVAVLLASAPALADTKIAVVRSVGEVLQMSAAVKAAADKTQGEFQKRNALLESQKKQFNDDVQKYQRDGATFSPEQRERTEKDLASRKAQLDYDGQRLQEDWQNKSGELQGEWMGKIQTVVTQVAKEKGFDVVVTNAIAVNKSLDITEEVTKRLDAENPVAAAPK